MNNKRMRLLVAMIAAVLLLLVTGCAPSSQTGQSGLNSQNAQSAKSSQVKIAILIVPKFEIGEMSGDAPGEAQYYYEEYCAGGEVYTLGNSTGDKVYVKDGVALLVTGSGKVASTMKLTTLLADNRFDFSETYLISTGCAGGRSGSVTLGDVVLSTAAVDYDLGYSADVRDLEDSSSSTWYHNADYGTMSYKALNTELIDKLYDAVKDTTLETTAVTRQYMAEAFNGADWAIRDPQVLEGTSVTSDSYWKGTHKHDVADYIVSYYNCRDPYAATEMEDVAVADVAASFGLLDRLIIIRDIVNEDVFMNGETPESLWGVNSLASTSEDDESETFGIFNTATENNFKVGKRVIELILDR